ncbi:MAG: hypothetical protein SF052_19730 [Bacteroidia bacterium]|nr:hypothetical protein [Bacteroidia bacterium]
MMEEKNQSNLRETLQKLPVYTPDDRVWNRIEQSLSHEQNKPQAIIRRFSPFTFNRVQWVAVISALLLITAGSLWLYRPQAVVPQSPTTFSEKELDPALPLSKAEITEYEHQLAEQEKELRTCIEKLPDQESEQIKPAMDMLKSITTMRDSMIRLLDEQGGNPGTEKRLQSLEKKRKELIRELRKKACGIQE